MLGTTMLLGLASTWSWLIQWLVLAGCLLYTVRLCWLHWDWSQEAGTLGPSLCSSICSQVSVRSTHGYCILRILEGSWHGCNICIASRIPGVGGIRIRGRVPHTRDSSILSAKCVVHNDFVTLKMLINNARALHVRGRETPGRRIGCFVRDVHRNRSSCKKPDTDVVRSPLHGVNTTAVCIETCSVACGAIVFDAASYIVPRLEMVSTSSSEHMYTDIVSAVIVL